MIYLSKSAERVSQIDKAKYIVFHIAFCILMTSSSIYICTLKLHSLSTCMHNKHTQRHLVEAENAISNYENYSLPNSEFHHKGILELYMCISCQLHTRTSWITLFQTARVIIKGCQNYTCALPVNSIQELHELLSSKQQGSS